MRFLDDLLAIWAATAALLVMIVVLPYNPARAVLGLPFVLFFPGYSLIAALYPRRQDLDGIERLGLSLGLSVAVVVLIGLVLNYTVWGIRLLPSVVSLTAFTTGCSLQAARRRKLLPPAERFAADAKSAMRALRGLPWWALGTSVILCAAILFGSFHFNALGGSTIGEGFTEFYVLAPGDKVKGYPRDVVSGQAVEVLLGIANHERRVAQYSIQIRTGTDVLRRIDRIVLVDGRKWESPVTFLPDHPQRQIRVDFLLFIDNNPTPYHRLHLWLNVRLRGRDDLREIGIRQGEDMSQSSRLQPIIRLPAKAGT